MRKIVTKGPVILEVSYRVARVRRKLRVEVTERGRVLVANASGVLVPFCLFTNPPSSQTSNRLNVRVEASNGQSRTLLVRLERPAEPWWRIRPTLAAFMSSDRGGRIKVFAGGGRLKDDCFLGSKPVSFTSVPRGTNGAARRAAGRQTVKKARQLVKT